MSVSVLLPQFFLPEPTMKLGRFVTSVNEPLRDFLDPINNSSFEAFTRVVTHYDSVGTLMGHHSFASKLTSLLSSSFSKRTKASIRITANQVKTYHLVNNEDWVRNTMQSEDVRRWIERTVDKGEDIYVVVDYHARIAEQSSEQTASISAALAATGVVVPVGNLTDPSFAS